MVIIEKGNLLQACEDIIVHQVNCEGVMGAGLAKQVKYKYPIVYEKYSELCARNRYNLLGTCQIVEVEPGKFVANLFGQEGYGRDGVQTDYDALCSSLFITRDFAEDRGLSVAIPHGLGCGLAGGDWARVYSIIERVFDCSDVAVTIYQLQEMVV